MMGLLASKIARDRARDRARDGKKAALAAIVLSLCAAVPFSQAQAQNQPKSYPGWAARPFEGSKGPVVEDSVLVCNGPDCAGEALSCTTFHGPGPSLHARMDLSMLGGGLPLPDISIWAIGKFARERGDLFGDPAEIKGPPPRMAYRPDRQSNYPYIVTTARLETRQKPVLITVALWAGEDTLYGLRCAALDDADGKGEKHVRALIAAVLAGDG
ncbi:MAG: hypothetical protein PW791_14015 [Neorhizobium sp.]|nr:hypothetical protein [Neorhizobium sp.]